MSLDKVQLSQLQRLCPGISKQQWQKGYSELVSDTRQWYRERTSHERVAKGGVGGAAKPETGSAPVTTGSVPAITTTGSKPKKVKKKKVKRVATITVTEEAEEPGQLTSEEEEQIDTVEAVDDAVTALNPTPQSKKELEESVAALTANASKVDEEHAMSVLKEEYDELEKTKTRIQFEIRTGAPNMTAARQKRAWAALEKLASTTLIVFKQNFQQQFQALLDVTESKSAEEEAKKEMLKRKEATPTGSWFSRLLSKSKQAAELLIQFAVTVVVGAVKLIIATLRYLWPKVTNLAAYVATLITTNPSSARITFSILNFLKKQLCRQLAVWWTSNQDQREQYQLDVDFFDPAAMAKNFTGPVLVKSLESVLQKGGTEKAAKLIRVGLKSGLGWIPLIGGLLTELTDLATDALTESVQESLQVYLYYSAVSKSLSDVVDLIDPRSCLRAFARTRREIKCTLSGISREECLREIMLMDEMEKARERCDTLESEIAALNARLSKGNLTGSRITEINAQIEAKRTELVGCQADLKTAADAYQQQAEKLKIQSAAPSTGGEYKRSSRLVQTKLF